MEKIKLCSMCKHKQEKCEYQPYSEMTPNRVKTDIESHLVPQFVKEIDCFGFEPQEDCGIVNP